MGLGEASCRLVVACSGPPAGGCSEQAQQGEEQQATLAGTGAAKAGGMGVELRGGLPEDRVNRTSMATRAGFSASGFQLLRGETKLVQFCTLWLCAGVNIMALDLVQCHLGQQPRMVALCEHFLHRTQNIQDMAHPSRVRVPVMLGRGHLVTCHCNQPATPATHTHTL